MKIAITAAVLAFAFAAHADDHMKDSATTGQTTVSPTTETPADPSQSDRQLSSERSWTNSDRDTASLNKNKADKKAMKHKSTSHSQVMDAQAALNRELAIGIAEDGKMGPETRAAVRQFQTEQGLQVSGQLDTATLQALGLSDMSSDRAPASVPMDPRTPETVVPESNPETDSVF